MINGKSILVAVWQLNFSNLEQLFNYPSAVRKIMYTTNAIEAVRVSLPNSVLFPDSVFKILYLRITEFYCKWNERPIANWALVRNQLLTKFDR